MPKKDPDQLDLPEDTSRKKSDDGKSDGKTGGPGKPGGKPPQIKGQKALGWVLLLALVVGFVLIMHSAQNAANSITYDEFFTHARNSAFTEEGVLIKGDRLVGTLKEGTAGLGELDNRRVEFMSNPANIHVHTYELITIGQDFKEDPAQAGLFIMFLLNWGPILLIAFLIYFFIFRAMRSAGGGPGGMLGGFGRSKHKLMNKEHSTVTLDDVAGVEEAKDEVAEIIEFLKNPKKFQRLGGRVPRGVLLVGQPGCGKTLLAKAMAGEADVPFFSISGSDFVEMFVGVGASRVRDLFKQAKESAPCIIFMDEIDAVGRRRGNGFSSGGHDEREQTLNAILVEMDGFESADQVIVIASTNRADVLDPALTRPGRFDRQVTVPLPDLKGRVEILKVHSRKIKLSPDVDLERAARTTPMFSGAELAALVNEAAIGATLQDKEFVEQEDLEEARDKIRFGRANKSRKVEQDERVATAYHEAGHAVVQYLLPHADPLHKVTIIPRGKAGGMTMSLPEKDRYGYGYKYIHDTMRVLCGGRIAEAKKTDDVSSGASMDIQMMTQFARAMVLDWGMSKRLGFVQYRAEDNQNSFMADKPYSDETAHIIDEEIKRFSDEAFAHAEQIIAEHWPQTVDLAEALLKYETLSKEEVEKLMKGEPLRKATVAELLAAESEKTVAPDANRPAPQPERDEDEGTAPGGLMPSPA
ncbi:MAG: ATP-dependent zinc metalloprotease FtsH [Planctomycetota bacterium]